MEININGKNVEGIMTEAIKEELCKIFKLSRDDKSWDSIAIAKFDSDTKQN